MTANGGAMFRYDTHVHTKETSRCGHLTAEQIVKKYIELGYDGICITDHLHQEYIDTLDTKQWYSIADAYLAGYRTAKEWGDKLGLSVILGVEIRFPESERDYLLYGVDEMFLYRHPFLYDTTPQAFYGTFCDEVLIIQAHPFRNYEFIHEGCIHGLEIVNGNPRHANRNDRALQYALDNPDLFRLCGSDTHRIGDEGQNALLSCAPIHDSFVLRDTILRRDYSLWSKNEKDIILAGCKNIGKC
jgi:hypothetical protein